MCWLVLSWNIFRFLDILVRGQIGAAFAFDRFSLLFWLETLLLVVPSVYLLAGSHWRVPSRLFLADVLIAVGGMLYRFDPTSFAFAARPGAMYFPSRNRSPHLRRRRLLRACDFYRRGKVLADSAGAGFGLA